MEEKLFFSFSGSGGGGGGGGVTVQVGLVHAGAGKECWLNNVTARIVSVVRK